MKVGYARVSTIDQDPSMQIEALKAAGCERIFHETKSGVMRDRPELRAALDYLRPGDTLVVWKLSRLARGLRQLIETKELLDERKFELLSLTEQIDTSNPYGRANFQFIGVLDELQREIIRENTLEGLANARRNGRRPGRKKTELTETQLKMAETLFAAGTYSASDIAAQLGISRSTLYRFFPGGRTEINLLK